MGFASRMFLMSFGDRNLPTLLFEDHAKLHLLQKNFVQS